MLAYFYYSPDSIRSVIVMRSTLHLVAFTLILVTGLTVRLVFTPYTAGSDIAQFAGFADTLLRHGLGFYEYADAKYYSEEGWPYNWPYVYGPQFLLIIAPLRALFNNPVRAFWGNGNYYVYIPEDWIIACKSVFIFFDVVSAILIYLILNEKSGIKYALTGMALYFLNPAVIYTSSIYGMFDQMALALLLFSIYLFSRNRLFASSFAAGVAASTKPNAALASIGIIMSMLLSSSRRKTIPCLAVFLLGALVFYIPFQVYYANTIPAALRLVLATGRAGYVEPIVYSFNGFSSLATYMHKYSGGDYSWITGYWWIPFSIFVSIALFRAFKSKKHNAAKDSLLFYLLFTSFYWRVNYQYLVISIGLSVLRIWEKPRKLVYPLVYSVYVALWTFIFPTSWWAHVHIEHPNYSLWNIMDMFSLMVFDEGVYVVYSLILTVISILFLVDELTT
ncbi:hypothetical protein ACSU1N_01910 [Thermogladius sp. 4427co]|uniref:hypothetical protein n=1 Tax=Thermogladius sp. 4427co TaxID=3450718 RepID=UPI003F79F045